MCGILGAIDFRKNLDDRYTLLQRGLKAIAHRGPDGSKELFQENIYLGHNRLSIIDLSPKGDQPMKSLRSNAFIIYNGEIYNYKELKNDLSEIEFNSNSDSEVLLEGYLNEGISFFKKLRGIYAFAIYDNRNGQKIILFRDPSGIKPLYIYQKQEFYVFGSEMKSLLPCVRKELSINESVIKCFLNLGYCPEPFTIYNEIKALEPGNAVEIISEGLKKTELIEFNFNEQNKLTIENNTKEVEENFKRAVSRNLVSDVEVAVALSGGIDSSLIYAYANKTNENIKALTVKFSDEDYNEEEIAKIYVSTLKGKHEFVEINADLNIDTLNKVLQNFDQPYADSSAINVFYLTKATRSITKVLIGGDGGDELFNGYPSQTWLTYIERNNKNKLSRKSGEVLLDIAKIFSSNSQRRLIKRVSDLWMDKPEELLYDWHSWFPRTTCFEKGSPFLFDTKEGLKLYTDIFSIKAPKDFGQYVVFDYFKKTLLSDYLRKTDMMAMLNSVEYRVPMLDEDMVRFALTIPFKQKSSLKESKKILRNIHRKKFPHETSKVSKKGFSIPLDKSLGKDDFNFIKNDLISNGNIVTSYIKKDYINFLFKALNNGTHSRTEISRAGIYQRILMLYSLSLWYNTK